MKYVVIHWDGNGTAAMSKSDAIRVARETGGRVKKLTKLNSTSIDTASGAGKDLKSVLRRIWHKSGARDVRLGMRFSKQMKLWRALRRQCSAENTTDRVLIFTPAPRFINTSKGDDAMINVTLGQVRARLPGAEIFLSTQSRAAEERVIGYGVKPVHLEPGNEIKSGFDWLSENRPSTVLVTGADVIDGAYDECFSLNLVALADLASRMGVVSGILGFSFSKQPSRKLAIAFNETCSKVRFNLRDPVSFGRFKNFSSATSQLTADIAFQLTPKSADCCDLANWVEDKRGSGLTVMALNAHPSVLPLGRRDEIPTFIAEIDKAVTRLMHNHRICFVLLPHDFGGGAADTIVLEPLFRSLCAKFPDRIIFSNKELEGAQVKGFVKMLDGVVSARMHLAIASLGSGTPVLGINYKDKMEGLFEHFGFLRESFLDAQDVLLGHRFDHELEDFVSNLPQRRSRISEKLAEVSRLSKINFDRIDGNKNISSVAA